MEIESEAIWEYHKKKSVHMNNAAWEKGDARDVFNEKRERKYSAYYHCAG